MPADTENLCALLLTMRSKQVPSWLAYCGPGEVSTRPAKRVGEQGLPPAESR